MFEKAEDVGPEDDGRFRGGGDLRKLAPPVPVEIVDIPVNRAARHGVEPLLAPGLDLRLRDQRRGVRPLKIRDDLLALFGKDVLLLRATAEQQGQGENQCGEYSFHRHIIVQIYKNNPIYEQET
ncbi:MAG: hypothetical protein ACLUNS_05160 [Alistipes shahii]